MGNVLQVPAQVEESTLSLTQLQQRRNQLEDRHVDAQEAYARAKGGVDADAARALVEEIAGKIDLLDRDMNAVWRPTTRGLAPRRAQRR
jgi:hypothetical protein